MRKTFEQYQKAAEQGVAEAQYNLGVRYYNGTGIAKDETQAVHWYQKAAEQGDADAQNLLEKTAQDNYNQQFETVIKKLLTPTPSDSIAPKKDAAQLHQELKTLNEYLKTFVKNHPQLRTTLFNNAIETGYLYFYHSDLFHHFSITNKIPVSSGKIKAIMQIDWQSKSFSEDISDRLNIVYDYLAFFEQNVEQLLKMKKELDDRTRRFDDERRRAEEQRIKLLEEQRNEQKRLLEEQRNERIKLINEQITTMPLLKEYSHCIEQQDNYNEFGTGLRLIIKMDEKINIVVSPKYNQSISRPVKLITQILEIIKQSESLESKVEKLKLKNWSIAYLSIDSKKFNDVDSTRACLKLFFPDSALEEVANMLKKYPIYLNIQSCGRYFGFYCRPDLSPKGYHQIYLHAGKLPNQYEFLRVFLHEYAHLLAEVNYGRLKECHGVEWKDTYQQLLLHFIQLTVFPEDVRIEIQRCIERGITRYD